MTQPDASPLDVVTGAFSYSGAAIARELLKRGHRVRTLTDHPQRPRPGRRSTPGRWTSALSRSSLRRWRAYTRCTTRTGCGSLTER
jgi:nucleoside-diphosphate-sugar epimerase